MTPRELIAELEATADRQDDLMSRLIDDLKSYEEASADYLGAVELHAHRLQQSRTAVISEALTAISERETDRVVAEMVAAARSTAPAHSAAARLERTRP